MNEICGWYGTADFKEIALAANLSHSTTGTSIFGLLIVAVYHFNVVQCHISVMEGTFPLLELTNWF